MRRKTAVYVRVSSNRQEFRSQVPDLRSWTDAYALDGPAIWFEDKVTGKTMDRPGWQQLEREIQAGRSTRVVVWRLDRLGRDAAGLVTLLDDLQTRGIQFVSIKDGIDLDTPAGRLMARVLASVASYENEVRSERIVAGMEAAKAEGKQIGGCKPGRRTRATKDKIDAIRRLFADGTSITQIAKAVQLSRPTIYAVLQQPKCPVE